MIPQSLVVSVTINGVRSKRIWDTREPLTLGYPTRWVLEREQNEVRIRDVAARVQKMLADGTCVPDVAPAYEKGETVVVVKGDAAKLAQGLSADLPQGAGSVEFKSISLFAIAHSIKAEAPNQVRIYGSRGDWTFDAQDLSAEHPSYTGYVGNQRAFRVERLPNHSYGITSYNSELTLRRGKENQPFLARQTREANATQMAGLTITHDDLQWHFQAVTDLQGWAGADQKVADDVEARAVQRSQKTAGGVLAAFLLLALLWPKPETLKEEPKQVVQLMIKKPAVKGYVTAAAQGDASARDHSLGAKKSNRPKGTDMRKTNISKKRSVTDAPIKMSQKPTPAKAKSAKSVVAKSKPAPVKMAPAKAAPVKTAAAKPVAQPKTVAKVTTPVKAPTQKAAPAPRRMLTAKAPAPRLAPKVTQKSGSLSDDGVAQMQIARAFGGKAFQTASRGALSGQMSGVRQLRRYDGNAIAAGSAQGIAPEVGDVNTHSGVGTHDVQVGTLGSSQGQFGVSGPGYGRGSNAAISGQGKSFVSMDTEDSEVESGLTREQVGAVIQKHMHEIRYCYESARLRAPQTEGRVSAAFTVGPNGSVTRTGVDQSTVNNSGLDACVLKRLATWKFPHPRGNVSAAVKFPFNFKPLVR